MDGNYYLISYYNCYYHLIIYIVINVVVKMLQYTEKQYSTYAMH